MVFQCKAGPRFLTSQDLQGRLQKSPDDISTGEGSSRGGWETRRPSLLLRRTNMTWVGRSRSTRSSHPMEGEECPSTDKKPGWDQPRGPALSPDSYPFPRAHSDSARKQHRTQQQLEGTGFADLQAWVEPAVGNVDLNYIFHGFLILKTAHYNKHLPGAETHQIHENHGLLNILKPSPSQTENKWTRLFTAGISKSKTLGTTCSSVGS